MKTFKQFILEAYDPEVQGRSQIRKQGEGGRVGTARKSQNQKSVELEQQVVVKLNLLKHIKQGRILVLKDQDLLGSSNQHKQEELLHYRQKKHRRKHI